MIYVVMWMFVGLLVAAYWVYMDITQEDTAYNLKELLGMTLVSALLGPALVGFLIHDRHKGKIAEFFEKPIIGRKK